MTTQSTRRNTKKRTLPPSMTKFDQWLNQHCESGEIVSFLFKYEPFGEAGQTATFAFDAKIFTVDRYHVYAELDLSKTDESLWSDPIWIAKDNIISAG